MQPSYIHVSDSDIKDSLGNEITLNSFGMYQNKDMLVIGFEAHDFGKLNMLIACNDNRSFKREEILEIDEWSEMKNFSLYCFLADIHEDLSVSL
jgi:hypothetical protein